MVPVVFTFYKQSVLKLKKKQFRRQTVKQSTAAPSLSLLIGPCNTQRQASELISGPNVAAKAFNRTKSRVVIDLLTGHNTPRRILHPMGLSNNPTCSKCRTEETSVHIL